MKEWEIINMVGVAPKTICLKYTKRGVSYYVSYSVYWDIRNRIHYFNPSTPFSVRCARRGSKSSELDYSGLIEWLNSKKLPIPQLPYKPQP